MRQIFNLNLLVSVEIKEKRKCSEFRWQEGLKIFGLTLVKIGFSQYFSNIIFSKEELEAKGYLIINQEVFYKPYVLLTFVNKQYKKEFDSLEEAATWGNTQAELGMKGAKLNV